MRVRYLFERGFLEESREFFSDVQSICESSEHKHTQAASNLLRECYNNQGTVANETNDPKGALYYFESWEKMLLERRAHNDQIVENAELAIMHQELAIALAFNEKYQESIDRLMKSWSIREKLDDFEETQLLWPVSNLGFIYCEVGRLQEGQDMLERYLKIQADAFGVDDTLSFRSAILTDISIVIITSNCDVEQVNVYMRSETFTQIRTRWTKASNCTFGL